MTPKEVQPARLRRMEAKPTSGGRCWLPDKDPPQEVQPARLRRMEAKPTSGGRCWLPDKDPNKKCNQPGYAAWRRSRQAEAGAGCRTRTPTRSATSPAAPHGGEADKRRPVLVAGQGPQQEVQPARLRRMEAKPTSGGRCWLPDKDPNKKCNQPACGPHPPAPLRAAFCGFGKKCKRGVWGSAPKRGWLAPFPRFCWGG